MTVPVFAADITLSWTYGADIDNVTGFKLYASNVSGEYMADDVLATIDYSTGQAEYSTNAVLEGEIGTVTTYYFVATAYNSEQESAHSNEVSYDVLGAPQQLEFSVTVSTK